MEARTKHEAWSSQSYSDKLVYCKLYPQISHLVEQFHHKNIHFLLFFFISFHQSKALKTRKIPKFSDMPGHYTRAVHVELAPRIVLIHYTIRGYTPCANFSWGFWYSTLPCSFMFKGTKLSAASMIQANMAAFQAIQYLTEDHPKIHNSGIITQSKIPSFVLKHLHTC